jgi:putative transposase
MISSKNNGAVFNLKFHMVWCPKYRLKVLTGEVEERLKHLLFEKAKQIKLNIESIEVMPDHVHLFISSNNTYLSPAKIAAQLKGYTSHELRKEFKHLTSRMPTLWSRSYYIGSIGQISESTVKKYIENQKTRS